MRIINIFFLISLINLFNNLLNNNVNCINIVYNNRLRNFGLRIIVFKEKKLSKIIKGVRYISDIYYYKAVVTAADGINIYNKLSDDDKTIIETIISSCY